MPMFTGKTELYNLAQDLGESNNLAAQHPEVVSQMEAMMKDAHTFSSEVIRSQVVENFGFEVFGKKIAKQYRELLTNDKKTTL